MIKKVGRKWMVLSETTGRSFGTYATKKEAVRRLGQVEFFKHRSALSAKAGAVKKRR